MTAFLAAKFLAANFANDANFIEEIERDFLDGNILYALRRESNEEWDEKGYTLCSLFGGEGGEEKGYALRSLFGGEGEKKRYTLCSELTFDFRKIEMAWKGR